MTGQPAAPAPHPQSATPGWAADLADDLKRGVIYTLKRRAKLAVYTVTIAAWALSQGLLPGQVAHWVELGLGLAGFLGIHQAGKTAK